MFRAGTAGPRRRWSIRLVAALGVGLGLLPGAFTPSAASPIVAPHVQVELVADVAAIEPGRDLRLGVHFVPEAEWHVYWRNPGDSGEAPRVEWSLPHGLTAGELEWPAPGRLVVGPIVSYGYPGEVLLAAPIASAGDLASGAVLETRARARMAGLQSRGVHSRERVAGVVVAGAGRGRRSVVGGTPLRGDPSTRTAARTRRLAGIGDQRSRPSDARRRGTPAAGGDAADVLPR